MLAIVFLLVTSLAGFAVITRAVPSAPTIVRAPAGFLLGVVFTSWTTYLVADALAGSHPGSALRTGLILSTILGAIVLAIFGRSLRLKHLKMPLVDAALTAFALALSWWLMHARLHTEKGDLLVSANTWGDTGLHVALSRSFSVGANYPPEYPFFAGEPIRYHFGFDFFAAMLQKGGISVGWSFNLPGIIGYTAMILATFATARLLFSPAEATRWFRDKGTWIGFVAAALLVTNQSLGWLRYLSHDGHGNLFTALKPSTWWHHESYLTGGPYTNDRITMFNTPNAYLTQTHLIVAMAIVLLISYVVLDQLRAGDRLNKRVLAGVGITFGAAFWLNGVVWLAAAVYITMLFVLWAAAAMTRRYRATEGAERWPAVGEQAWRWIKIAAVFVVPALALGIPQAIMLNGGGTHGGIRLHLGYLACGSTHASCHGGDMHLFSLSDWWSFIQFWWLNEGLFIPLLIGAFVLGTGRDKKVILAATSVFVWGNLIQVGLDVGGQNHKVFNLWENLNGPFVGFALVSIWIIGGGLLRRGKRLLGVSTRVVAVAAGWILIVSGLIDFMTVKNDFSVSVFGDATQQQATDWIIHHTPPRATFLADYDQLYSAPTLAGRGVALGYSSWASSAGYDIEPRKAEIAAIYSATDRDLACARVKQSGLDYILIGPQERTSPRFKINEAAFAQMTPAVTIGTGDQEYRIYKVADNC